MMAALEAGVVYSTVVFAVGFILGTIRVLLVVPHLGETPAVILETPVMLAVSWMVSRWSAKRFCVPDAIRLRLLMGAVAFALLTFGEVGVSTFVFGRSWPEVLAAYQTFPGALGLAAQIAFAAFPLIQMGRG